MPESVLAAFTPRRREWIGKHGYDSELTHYEFSGAPPQDVEQARAVLSAANLPCPNDIAVKAAMTLRLRTNTRKENAADLDAIVTLFAADMTQYPADIVVETCRRWGETETWFPSWAELRDGLEWRVRKRRMMKEALDGI